VQYKGAAPYLCISDFSAKQGPNKSLQLYCRTGLFPPNLLIQFRQTGVFRAGRVFQEALTGPALLQTQLAQGI